MAQPPPPRSRPLPVLFALLCVLAAGAVVSRTAHRRPVPPPVVPHYTRQQAATAQQHLDALRDQVLRPPPTAPPRPSVSPAGDNMPDAPPAPPESVRLQLSQADLNTYLATNPEAQAQLRAHGVRAVQVLLRRPHNVIFRASVLYRGRPADFQIAGALQASPGTGLRLDATSAQIGNLPLPPKFVSAQADKLADQFTRQFRRRLAVDGVEVQGDQLVLTGTRRKPG